MSAKLLDGGPDGPMGSGHFERGTGRPIVKYRDTLQSSMQKWLNRSRFRLVEGSGCPENHVSGSWGLDPSMGRGILLGKEEPIVSIGCFCRELCKND